MASKQMLVALAAIVFAVLPAIARATDYVVGDNDGWRTDFNYSAWAEKKEFRVGDTISFNYSPGDHNVIEVGGADFKVCNVPEGATALTSGSDKITLTSAGRRWFLCGMAGHCETGQKVLISVKEALALPPWMPPSANDGVSAFSGQALMVAVMAMAMLAVI